MGNENTKEESPKKKKKVLPPEGIVIISSTENFTEEKGVKDYVVDLWEKGLRTERLRSYNHRHTIYFDPSTKSIVYQETKRKESSDGQVNKMKYFDENNIPYLLTLSTKVLEFGGTRRSIKITNLMTLEDVESHHHEILNGYTVSTEKNPKESIIICSSHRTRTISYMNIKTGEFIRDDHIGAIIDNHPKFEGKYFSIHSIQVLDFSRLIVSLNYNNVEGIGVLMMWNMKEHKLGFILEDDIGGLYFDKMIYHQKKNIVIGGKGDVCRTNFVVIDPETLKIIKTCEVGFLVFTFCLLEGDNELVCAEMAEHSPSLSFWNLDTYRVRKKYELPPPPLDQNDAGSGCWETKIIDIPHLNSILISTRSRLLLFDKKKEIFTWTSSNDGILFAGGIGNLRRRIKKKMDIPGEIDCVGYYPCVEDRKFLRKSTEEEVNDRNERSKFLKEFVCSQDEWIVESVFLFQIKLENGIFLTSIKL